MAWWVTCLGVTASLLGGAALAEAFCERRNRRDHPPPGDRVDIGGRRLHLWTMGDAPGPTVVVEQGAGGPSLLWEPIQREVAGFARICLYDRAGYLWSDAAPTGRRSLAERVEDLHRGLTAAGVPGPYVLVAHSFGGPLVRRFAQTYPDMVAGMVLVDTPEEAVIASSAYAAYGRMLSRIARVAEILAVFGIVRVAVAVMLRTGPDSISRPLWQAFKALLPCPGYFRATADDALVLPREAARLKALGRAGCLGDLPLVVIRHGIAFPGAAAVLEPGWEEGQHRLAALSTRGELVLAAGSNHMVQNDEPDLVVAAIRRVVCQAQAASGPRP